MRCRLIIILITHHSSLQFAILITRKFERFGRSTIHPGPCSHTPLTRFATNARLVKLHRLVPVWVTTREDRAPWTLSPSVWTWICGCLSQTTHMRFVVDWSLRRIDVRRILHLWSPTFNMLSCWHRHEMNWPTYSKLCHLAHALQPALGAFLYLTLY